MTNVRLLSSCLMAASCCLSLPSYAQEIEKPFVGLDYSQRTYENDSNNVDDTTIPAVRLRAGTELDKYFGIEAHLAIGAGNDTGTINGSSTYKIESPITYAAFLRPQVKLGPVTLYALGGYAYVEFEYSSTGTTGKPIDSTSDFAFGAGAQLDLGKHLGLNVDFVQYVEGFSGVSGGLMYRF